MFVRQSRFQCFSQEMLGPPSADFSAIRKWESVLHEQVIDEWNAHFQ
jgi:hypothetical protein